MGVITGQAATWTIGGTLNGKAEEWQLTTNSENLDVTGCGDAYKERVHLHYDWEARLTMKLQTGSTMNPYTSALGTEVAIALKRKSTDSNAFFTGTGLLENIETGAKYDEEIKAVMTVRCSTGSAPTINTAVA